MTPTRAMVLEWLEGWSGATLTPAGQADVLQATAREGSAAEELMSAFAARFGVDMTGYRPAMHGCTPTQVLRPDWPFRVPPTHGTTVPLSVSLLHAAALAGRWPVVYPDLPVARDLSVANVPLLMTGLVAVTLLVLWAVPRLF